MELKKVDEVARLLVSCQHGKYFCADEFLAVFLDSNNRLFTFYRKQHPVMRKSEEIYETGLLGSEEWITKIRPFVTIFCMTFETYHEISLLVTLGAEREKVLSKKQLKMTQNDFT